MIVDDLCAESPALRALCQDARVIRVPFPVYPFDRNVGRLRWVRDRAPRGLIRPDGVRAPYPTVILVSERAEPGFQVVRTEYDESGNEHFVSLIVGRVSDGLALDVDLTTSSRMADGRLVAVSGFAPVWAWLSQHMTDDWVRTWQDPQPCPTRDEINTHYAQYLAVRAALLVSVNGWLPYPDYFEHPGQLSDDELTARLAETAGMNTHQYQTLACAFSLMSCKNVVLRHHVPTDALQHARARRGYAPLVTWSELLVRPFGVKGSRTSGLHGDDLRAIHWVRGHVKEYTSERPLFGNPKNVGAFWWQPHLAGTPRSGLAQLA